jgi:hypothetical protein
MKLTAPKARAGIVMCSASGQTDTIDANGQIEVSAVDVSDLLSAGFSPKEAAPQAATF